MSLRVLSTTEILPPTPDALNGKLRRLVGHTDVHHAAVVLHIIGSIGNRGALGQTGEVVDVDLGRRTLTPPAPAGVL